jgi:integrase
VIRDGRHFKTAESKRHTLEELIDRFISQWLTRHPKDTKKQTALLTWWKKRLGHLLLAEVTPAVIAEARDALLSESTNRNKLRSSSTVNRYLAALSKAFSIAITEWGWLEDSPIKKVNKPREAPGRDRFLSIEEKERLLAACQAYLYPLVNLSILTAMRFGELVNLRWEDLDFQQRTITLRLTKNGDTRVIPLTVAAESSFKLCPTYEPHLKGLIFRSKRQNNLLGVVSVRRGFENALNAASISNFRWHDLRHTAASYIAMKGATQGELMAILGHRSPGMTRRYAHYSQDHYSL